MCFCIRADLGARVLFASLGLTVHRAKGTLPLAVQVVVGAQRRAP